MLNNPLVTIQEGPRSRNELTLSPTYYAMVDNWIEQLGYDGYCIHMKLQTMVDRRDARYADNHIPMSINTLVEKLGISKKIWYKVAKLYYEFGLIDFITYEDSNNEGTKPINVIVYPYPEGKASNGMQPLAKLRDWNDYKEAASGSQGKGGRPKKDTNTHSGGVSHGEQGGVSVEKQGGVSPEKHNNSSKDLNNSSKDLSNSSNSFVNKQEVNSSPNELSEDQIKKIFSDKVQDSAFRHYPEMRNEYKMTKPGFIALVDQFINETVRDGRHMEINDLHKYVDGFFANVRGHRAYRERLLNGSVPAAF